MRNYLQVILLFLIFHSSYSQTVDFERVTKESPIKIRGGVSANTIFYNSNLRQSRLPFTYYFNGNLTFSLYGFSVPLSFNYSNQGANLGYSLPFNLNRLSIHPKYKWLTAHIGDVAMTFSPYTLGGHQFTGVGFDVVPKGPFKISVMGGRLLKATEDDGNNFTIPAFQRMGYAIKTAYEKEKYKVGFTAFYAKDDLNSIKSISKDKKITPKENLALSLEGAINITENLSLFGEYATSTLTNDLRSEEANSGSSLLLTQRTSTDNHYALKAGLNYQIEKTVLGVGYERISPEYETLGAYYFNNDFENITFNASKPFFNDKVNLMLNVGFQRDDLENTKSNATSRIVGAINTTINASDKLTLTGSYSNFQTYTNVKLNQFDVINDNTNLDNVTDTLNYRQLSQSANLNINYFLKKTKENNQSVNLNYSFNDVANEQGGIVRIGNASTFHNLNSSYSLSFPKKKMNVRIGGNLTVNTIGRDNGITWGPMLNLTKRLFEEKLNTGLGFYYSSTENRGITSNIMNIRANLNYSLLQKHNFMLSAVQLFRSVVNNDNLNELTVTFGYNYNFGILNSKKKKPKNKKNNTAEKTDNTLKIKFKDYDFSGSIESHRLELAKFSKNNLFDQVPTTLKNSSESLNRDNLSLKEFKSEATKYLEKLYSYKKIEKEFKKDFRMAFSQLLIDARKIDEKIYAKYLSVEEAMKSAQLSGNESEFLRYKENLKTEEKRLASHRKMIADLEEIDKIDNEEEFNKKVNTLVKEIMPSYFDLKMNNKNDEDIIINILQVKIADYYHRKN